MRPVFYLTMCLWAYITVTHAADEQFSEWLKSRSPLVEQRNSKTSVQKVRRDTSTNDAFTKAFLEELIKELKKLNYIRERYETEEDEYAEPYVSKRKAFWQPMGGPLPVETRLASFGSRIEPDRTAESPNGFKGMRYGRR